MQNIEHLSSNDWDIESTCQDLILTTVLSSKINNKFNITILEDLATLALPKLAMNNGDDQTILVLHNDIDLSGDKLCELLFEQSGFVMIWLKEVGYVRNNFGFLESN